MVYDCFTFFNELDLLEIRLNILNDVVDKFVIVEANRTFSNKEKPLYFLDNIDRFEKFRDKIIHIVVDDFPEFEDAWVYEYFQRNAIARGLVNCQDKDDIIISDLDEIPNPIEIYKNKNKNKIIFFKQKMYYYYLNNLNIRNPYWFDISSKMLKYEIIKKECFTPQKIRFLKPDFLKSKVVHNGGWHFSYLGGACSIIKKIESFSHQEFNFEKYKNKKVLEEKILEGRDLFSEKNKIFFVGVDLNISFPKYIINNEKKYNFLFVKPRVKFYFKVIIFINKTKSNLLLFLKRIKNTIKKI